MLVIFRLWYLPLICSRGIACAIRPGEGLFSVERFLWRTPMDLYPVAPVIRPSPRPWTAAQWPSQGV